MQIRASVKVINPENPRAGTAGMVWAPVKEGEPVLVKFDLDDAEVSIPFADLVAL